MTYLSKPPQFKLGRIVITLSAAEKLVIEDVQTALVRHQSGDWGEMDEHDWAVNEEALGRGGDLFSLFRDRNGTEFFVDTSQERGETTVLLRENS